MIREYIGVYIGVLFSANIRMYVFYRDFIGDSIRYDEYKDDYIKKNLWVFHSPSSNSSHGECFEFISDHFPKGSYFKPIHTSEDISEHRDKYLMMEELLK